MGNLRLRIGGNAGSNIMVSMAFIQKRIKGGVAICSSGGSQGRSQGWFMTSLIRVSYSNARGALEAWGMEISLVDQPHRGRHAI